MSRTSRLPVWFQWIVVTSGCIGLDAFLLYGIDKLRSSLGCYDPIFVCNPVGWSLLGVEPFVLFGIIGLGQWLVLRRQIGRSTAWILVSAIISPVAIIAMLVIGWLLA